MKRLVGLTSVVLILAGCQDIPAPQTAPPGPSAEIVDAANGGRSGFYFLAPLVSDPALPGAFDPAFLPFLRVTICEWENDGCVGAPVAEFTSQSGTGSERLRVDLEAEHYIVNWHTGESDLDATKNYRIIVTAGPVELGHADVDVASTGRELRNVDTGEFVALKDGSTLPVKFWIADGIPGVAVIGAQGGQVSDATGDVVASVPPNALTTPTVIALERTTTEPPSDVLAGGAAVGLSMRFLPDGLALNAPVNVLWNFENASIGDEADIVVVHWNEAGTFLDVVAADVDPTARTAQFQLDHFSVSTILDCGTGSCPSTDGWSVYDVKWTIPVIQWYVGDALPPGSWITPTAIASELGTWETEQGSFTFQQTLDRSQANLIFEDASDLATAPCGGLPNYMAVDLSPSEPSRTCFRSRLFSWQKTLGAGDQVLLRFDSNLLDAASAPHAILHAIGHALGIAHTNRDNDAAVMDADTPDVPTTLHAWDIAALQYLYGQSQVLFDTVAVGLNSSCALARDGRAFCWGFNGLGQLGDGTTSSRGTLAEVAGGHRYTSISVGAQYACAVATDAKAYCWGYNLIGQLGIGSTDQQIAPVEVQGGLQWAQLSVPKTNNPGANWTCGVTTSGAAYCWGLNSEGQLGTTSTEQCALSPTYQVPCSTVPLPVQSSETFRSIAVGTLNGRWTCAITVTDQLYCWGRAFTFGGTPFGNVPTLVSGIWSSVALGYFLCGVDTANDGYCWGSTSPFGAALGDGVFGTDSDTPVRVDGAPAFSAMTLGPANQSYACGLTTAGNVYCWGRNLGRWGNSSTDASAVPVLSAGGMAFRGIDAAFFHMCGVTPEGALYCWGLDSFGYMLGTPPTSTCNGTPCSPEPVLVEPPL